MRRDDFKLLEFALLLWFVGHAVGYGAEPLDERAWTEILIGEMREAGENARAGKQTPDGSWPDIETDTHAFEVDWTSKWKEGIGQAQFYARATGKKPGLILLMDSGEQQRIFYLRALVACGDEIELRTRFVGKVPEPPPKPDPPKPDPPKPDPGPTEPEPAAALLQPSDFEEYLGYFRPPGRLPKDAAAKDARLRQFPFSPAKAALTPRGTLIVAGHEHGTYAGELTIPIPSTTEPPVAEWVSDGFVQLLPDVEKATAGYTQPRVRSLLVADGNLHVSYYQYYNAARREYPSLQIGPADLVGFPTKAVGPLWVFDADGKRMDHQLVAHPLVVTPRGLGIANQGGRNETRSYGPALALLARHAAPGSGDALYTFDRQLLFYPFESRIFPEPIYAGDGLPWFAGSAQSDGVVIGRTYLAVGRLGYGTGLEHYQPYSQGTIKVANGVATLTSGTFPEWVGHLRFAGGHRDGEAVETRDSETQVTLANELLNAPAGTAFSACYGPPATTISRSRFYGAPANYPVDGVDCCTGPASKGFHSPPYDTRGWLFDFAELVDAADPSEPRPYAFIDFSSPELLGETKCGFLPGCVLHDKSRNWLILGEGGADPKFHVIQLKRTRSD